MIDSPFLNRLKTNKSNKEEFEEFKKNELKKYRELTKDDSFKCGFVGVYFETKGKGEWEVLQSIHRCCIDCGKIGESWGEVYLYDNKNYTGGGINIPRKFKIKSHRILIKKEE